MPPARYCNAEGGNPEEQPRHRSAGTCAATQAHLTVTLWLSTSPAHPLATEAGRLQQKLGVPFGGSIVLDKLTLTAATALKKGLTPAAVETCLFPAGWPLGPLLPRCFCWQQLWPRPLRAGCAQLTCPGPSPRPPGKACLTAWAWGWPSAGSYPWARLGAGPSCCFSHVFKPVLGATSVKSTLQRHLSQANTYKSICHRPWQDPFAANNSVGSSLALPALGHRTPDVSPGLSFSLARDYSVTQKTSPAVLWKGEAPVQLPGTWGPMLSPHSSLSLPWKHS